MPVDFAIDSFVDKEKLDREVDKGERLVALQPCCSVGNSNNCQDRLTAVFVSPAVDTACHHRPFDKDFGKTDSIAAGGRERLGRVFGDVASQHTFRTDSARYSAQDL